MPLAARRASPSPQARSLDAHGLLTRLADTARIRVGRLAVGNRQGPGGWAGSGWVSTQRNAAQMTHNPEGSRLPRRLRGLPTRQSLSRTGLTLWASWGAVAARECQAPTSASNLGPRSQPKSPPPAGLHGPQRELTFHIGLLRFEYARREVPGLHWSAELPRALGAWPPGGSPLAAGCSSAYGLI